MKIDCMRLYQLRIEANLSLRELEKACGVSHSSINLYEKGLRQPKSDALEVLARYFNVDVDYLTGQSDFKRKETAPEAKLTEAEERIIKLLKLVAPDRQHHIVDAFEAQLKALGLIKD